MLRRRGRHPGTHGPRRTFSGYVWLLSRNKYLEAWVTIAETAPTAKRPRAFVQRTEHGAQTRRGPGVEFTLGARPPLRLGARLHPVPVAAEGRDRAPGAEREDDVGPTRRVRVPEEEGARRRVE